MASDGTPRPVGFVPGGPPPAPSAWTSLPLPLPPPPPTLPADRSGTYAAVGTIREGMSYYRWALVVLALTALVYAVAGPSLGVNTVVGIPGHPPTLDNATVDRLVNQSGSLRGVSLVAGLFGVIGLALELVSYLKWREGTKLLERSGWEYGATQLNEAREANGDRRLAFGAFLLQFLFGLVVAAILFEILYQVLQSRLPGGVPLAPGQLNDLQTQLSDTVLVAAIVSWAFTLALYFFASRSLVRTLDGLVGAEPKAQLAGGRAIVLGGPALNIVAVFGILDPYLFLAGVLSPLVIALGISRLIHVYDAWMVRPPPLTPMGFVRSPF